MCYLEKGASVWFDYIGMITENTDPSPGLLATVIDPPTRSTAFLTIDNPRPVPAMLPVFSPRTKGSNIFDRSALFIPNPRNVVDIYFITGLNYKHINFDKEASDDELKSVAFTAVSTVVFVISLITWLICT